MNLIKKVDPILQKAGTIAICMLIFLCFSFAGQLQLLKLLPLGVVCLCGFLALLRTRGQVISRNTWCWIALYILYNLIWSVIGFKNNHEGVSAYFRLGIIWSIIFVFVIAACNERRAKALQYVIFGIAAWHTIVIVIYIGHILQLWPNFIKWLYPETRLGIHVGYLHIVSHHLGALAFCAPAAYGYMVLDAKGGVKRQIAYGIFWFLVVFAVVATSRRMLYIVLLVCAAAMLVVPLLLKKDRKKLLMRSIVGLALTTLFLGSSVIMISQITTVFLKSNYDEIVAIVQKKPVEEGNIKYTDRITFDPFNVDFETLIHETRPEPEIATAPNTEPPTDPVKNDGLQGFNDRMEDMSSELQGESTRGGIIASVLANWRKQPLIGVGFGADLPGLEPNAGIYEMEYVVRLYTTGLLGMAFLLVLMLYVGVAPLLRIKKEQCEPILLAPITVAYLGAVIATISNPYIFSGFDYLLMLFLPVAYLNSCMSNSAKD